MGVFVEMPEGLSFSSVRKCLGEHQHASVARAVGTIAYIVRLLPKKSIAMPLVWMVSEVMRTTEPERSKSGVSDSVPRKKMKLSSRLVEDEPASTVQKDRRGCSPDLKPAQLLVTNVGVGEKV